LATLLGGAPAPAPAPDAADRAPRYLERIGVEMHGRMRIVPVAEIDFIAASGDYAELHAGEDTFVIREQMQALEHRLDPRHFVRIHRSTIVRLDRVDSLLYSAGGDYAVRLRDGRRLRVSRGRYEALQRRLGLDADGAP
ncbi:MAG: LytTR family DNA-binding domain-containing protein, partial [Rhodothermales bacterium]|nr:LytTR family DNA-binding domain-containing protein [Rhodothermales bacterium]